MQPGSERFALEFGTENRRAYENDAVFFSWDVSVGMDTATVSCPELFIVESENN